MQEEVFELNSNPLKSGRRSVRIWFNHPPTSPSNLHSSNRSSSFPGAEHFRCAVAAGTFFHACVCVCVLSFQSCPLCDSMACSPPGSSVHGILQARILEWVAVPSSRGIFLTQGLNLCLLHLPALAGRFFTTSATWEAHSFIYSVKTWPEFYCFEPKRITLILTEKGIVDQVQGMVALEGKKSTL